MQQMIFTLTEENINSAVEQIKAYFTGKKVSDHDVLKLGLLVEEALLRCRDRFGREQEVTVETSDFVSFKAAIRLQAEAFNPLQKDAGSILNSDFLNNLLEGDGPSISYRYRNSCNVVTVMASCARRDLKIPGGHITLAIVGAIIAALLTKALPDSVAAFLLNDLAAPLFSRLMSLI